MTKKYFALLAILTTVLCFCACSDNQNKNDVFTNNMFIDVDSITYYDFNGTKYTSYDKNIIEKVASMLVSAKLEELDKDKYLEGSYSFILNKQDGTSIDVCLGSVIGYDYKQYYTDNIKDNYIVELINKIKETSEDI